jgi:hypothetical protein
VSGEALDRRKLILNSLPEQSMPLKVNVGLSKKIGQPDYGSLGASCHVEYEADAALLNTDLETFHRQVKNAFIACRQAVQDELYRHQSAEPGQQAANNQPSNGQYASPSNGQTRNGHANGQPGNQRRSNGRKATASQVRALEAISNRLQLDLNRWLYEKFGLRIPAELSIGDASIAIDELNATPSSNGADH